LIGFACLRSGEKGAPLEFLKFRDGDETIAALDYENSIGLGIISLPSWYFLGLNYLVHMQPLGLLLWSLYFVVCISFYAFIVGGTNGLKVLNNNTPALTRTQQCHYSWPNPK
jgi:hypothetical protein